MQTFFFLSYQKAMQEDVRKEMGYTCCTPLTLGVPTWQDAAFESQLSNITLSFKQLYLGCVLHPIYIKRSGDMPSGISSMGYLIPGCPN
jgi:hypothetical protein